MPELHRFSSATPWALAAAKALRAAIGAALAERETVLVAISGGRGAAAVLPLLGLDPPPWRRIVFTPADDRLAPPGHAVRAGVRMSAWLKGARSGGARLIELDQIDRTPDVLLLEQLHPGAVASLFPAGQGMESAADPESVDRIARVTPDPMREDAPFARITLTMSALLAPPRRVLIGAGADKAAQIDAALADSPPRSPLAMLLQQDRAKVSVYLSAETLEPDE